MATEEEEFQRRLKKPSLRIDKRLAGVFAAVIIVGGIYALFFWNELRKQPKEPSPTVEPTSFVDPNVTAFPNVAALAHRTDWASWPKNASALAKGRKIAVATIYVAPGSNLDGYLSIDPRGAARPEDVDLVLVDRAVAHEFQYQGPNASAKGADVDHRFTLLDPKEHSVLAEWSRLVLAQSSVTVVGGVPLQGGIGFLSKEKREADLSVLSNGKTPAPDSE